MAAKNLLQLRRRGRVEVGGIQLDLKMARTGIGLVKLQTLHLERHDLIAALRMLELAFDLHDGVFLQRILEVVVLEAHAFNMPRRVFEHEVGHLLALLRKLHAHAGNQTSENSTGDIALVLRQISQMELGYATQRTLERTKRMVRNVNLQNLLLVGKQRTLVPFDAVRRRNILLKAAVFHIGEHVEHAHLTGIAVALTLGRALKKRRFLNEVHELLARITRAIERARFDKRLERFAVVALRIQTIHEIVQAGVRTVRIALGDDGLGHRAADTAHACQTEADSFVKRRELKVGRIDVGRQNRNIAMRAASDVFNQLVRIAHIAGKHRSHVFMRIVCLQIRRAHNQNGICRRVRFVERILRELLRVFPDFLGDFQRIAVFHRAVAPVVLELHHDVELFLAHCLTKLVGLTGRKTAHDHGNLHDLLLVDHGAVRFLEKRAQAVVIVMNRRLAACNLDVVLDHAGFQRTRTVQSN